MGSVLYGYNQRFINCSRGLKQQSYCELFCCELLFFYFCEIACTVSFSSTQNNFKVLFVQVPDIFVCIMIIINNNNNNVVGYTGCFLIPSQNQSCV